MLNCIIDVTTQTVYFRGEAPGFVADGARAMAVDCGWSKVNVDEFCPEVRAATTARDAAGHLGGGRIPSIKLIRAMTGCSVNEALQAHNYVQKLPPGVWRWVAGLDLEAAKVRKAG